MPGSVTKKTVLKRADWEKFMEFFRATFHDAKAELVRHTGDPDAEPLRAVGGLRDKTWEWAEERFNNAGLKGARGDRLIVTVLKRGGKHLAYSIHLSDKDYNWKGDMTYVIPEERRARRGAVVFEHAEKAAVDLRYPHFQVLASNPSIVDYLSKRDFSERGIVRGKPLMHKDFPRRRMR
jgi:hypothetical protein